MRAIHPQTKIGAVHLTVHDRDRLTEYYQGRIGLRRHWQTEESVALGVGGPDLLVLHEDRTAARVAGAAGLYHFALLLPTRRDLARTLRHLVSAETPLSGFADHLVSEAIYLSDPEGNGIEIYRDRPRDAWRYDPTGKPTMGTLALDVDGLLATLADDAAPWDGLPAGSTVGHIHLHVGDLAETRAFYQEGLGFDFVADYGHAASFVSAGGYHHHVGYNLWGGRQPRPDGALGLRRFEIRFPDASALAAVRDRLQAHGIVGWREDGLGLTRADPSGIVVSLTTPAPA